MSDSCSCGEKDHWRFYFVRNRAVDIAVYFESAYVGVHATQTRDLFECTFQGLPEYTIEFEVVDTTLDTLFGAVYKHIVARLVRGKKERQVIVEEDWGWGNDCKPKLEALVAKLPGDYPLTAKFTRCELPKPCQHEPNADVTPAARYRQLLAENKNWTRKEFDELLDRYCQAHKDKRPPEEIEQARKAVEDARDHIIWYRHKLAGYMYQSLREAGLPQRESCSRDEPQYGLDWPHGTFNMVWDNFQVGVVYNHKEERFFAHARDKGLYTMDVEAALAFVIEKYFTLFPSKSALIAQYVKAAYDEVRTCRQKSVYVCTFPGGFTLELEDKMFEADTLYEGRNKYIRARLMNASKEVAVENWHWDKSCKDKLEALVARITPLVAKETKCDFSQDCPPVPLQGAELVEWYRKELASIKYVTKTEFNELKRRYDQAVANKSPDVERELARVKEAQTAVLQYRERAGEYIYQSLRVKGMPERKFPCYYGSYRANDVRWPDNILQLYWGDVGFKYDIHMHFYQVYVKGQIALVTQNEEEVIARILQAREAQ